MSSISSVCGGRDGIQCLQFLRLCEVFVVMVVVVVVVMGHAGVGLLDQSI